MILGNKADKADEKKVDYETVKVDIYYQTLKKV